MKIHNSGRLMWVAFVSFSALAPTALADTKLTVTFRSDPPGATIYENGKAWGAAPMALRYNAPGRFTACLPLRPITLRWVSGAEVALNDVQACPAAGKKQEFTVFRPEGVPGAEIDAQYAVALVQQRATAQAAAPVPVVTAPKFCTTTVIGTQIFTTCT